MIESPKLCPQCRVELEIGHMKGLRTYQCPADHGVAINIVDAYRHLQRDELQAIWQAAGAADAPKTELLSPVSNDPMVRVTFLADDDLAVGNRTPGAREITIEVDPETHYAWFQLDELRQMPVGDVFGTPGLVSVDDVVIEDREHSDIFDKLTPEDFQDDDDWPSPSTEGGISGLLKPLWRRIRS